MSYWLGLARDWFMAIVVVVAAFATWQWVNTPYPLSAGPAPAFELPGLDEGQTVRLADFGTDPVILNFWFSDCGPCRSEIPELSAWSKDHPKVPIIGVSTDRMDLPMLRTRAKQLGVEYTVGHDQYARTAADYSVSVFPTTVLIEGGEIRMVRMGPVNQGTLSRMVETVRPGFLAD